jgi:hypothetical protein
MLGARSLLVALFVLGAAALPQPAQAQFDLDNFCTIFESFPNTSGVESALFESWNDGAADWDADSRWILTYQNGNPTEFRFQERTAAGAWADSARALGAYDPADRLTECTFQSVDAGQATNLVRTVLTYNADGRLATETVQNWDTTATAPAGDWFNSQRSTYTYDGSGNVSQRVDDFWDRGTQTWVNSARIQNTYDASNRLTVEVVQQSDGSGGWLNNERTQNTYGPDGLTETLEEEWDLAFQVWRNDYRTVFSYPGADTEVEVDQDWTGANWENDERRTLQLNANDLPETEIVEQWTGSSWVNSDRTQNSYALIGGIQKLEQSLEQTWALSGPGAWVNASRTTLSYSGIIPVELAHFGAWSTGEQALLRWRTESETNNAGFEVHHRPAPDGSWRTLGFVESNVAGGTTSDPQSYRFRTGSLALGTHDFRLRQVDLDGTATLTDPVSITVRLDQPLRLVGPSPHPVSGRATLSFALDREADVEVTLYNLLGQRVRVLHKGTAAPNRDHTLALDTRGLSSGQYVLRLRAGDHVQTHPVTVVR